MPRTYVPRGKAACRHCSAAKSDITHHNANARGCEYDPRHREISEPITRESCVEFFAALIDDAVTCSRKSGLLSVAEAREWIMGTQRGEPPVTFAFCCDVVGLDVEDIRSRLVTQWGQR